MPPRPSHSTSRSSVLGWWPSNSGPARLLIERERTPESRPGIISGDKDLADEHFARDLYPMDLSWLVTMGPLW